MVKVRQAVPVTAEGALDWASWVARIVAKHPRLAAQPLTDSCAWTHQQYPDQLAAALELGELVADLRLDTPSVVAALVYRLVRTERVSKPELVARVDREATDLVYSVAAMATTSLLEMSDSPMLAKEQQSQVENVKRMLASMIDDARVAVIKLAERVVALRYAKNYDPQRRQRIAQEAGSVFAPLANRLGLWQLKWELEDLSLRYLQEDIYLGIAKQLSQKRQQREAQVEAMTERVVGLLGDHGVSAEVEGRAKNIFSIWRKMQAKNVPIAEVYDVRAVRIIVDSLADCYAALGVIHTTWQHLPAEFDDYIAVPKENGYQSIHTAITADDGDTLEVQIRTRQMHEDAELGVCAHWAYKSVHNQAVDEDASFAAKMDWLRQVMEWHEELGGGANLNALLYQQTSQQRVFITTPQGHVLDLASGATVLDFAYRVHTDLGERCVGGLVNGVQVPMQTRLQTGQQVEVIVDSQQRPKRQWLEPSLNILFTHRARAKVVSYFRVRDEADLALSGRELLLELQRQLGLLGSGDEFIDRCLDHSDYTQEAVFLSAVAMGVVSYIELLAQVLTSQESQSATSAQPGLPGINTPESVATTTLQVVAANRQGLLNDITQLFAAWQVSLMGASGRVSNSSEHAIITLEAELPDGQQLLQVMSLIMLLKGVEDVTRLLANER
ncbi:MAG TPA: GTP diphosphokinase [Gammaproteobacteria bacterium]|nr:GTP diphosphokinase [Gammaproteobacteria bacterium]